MKSLKFRQGAGNPIQGEQGVPVPERSQNLNDELNSGTPQSGFDEGCEMNTTNNEPLVLIVEASRLLGQAAAQACTRRRVRSHIVSEAGEALTLVGRSKPTAILTALELPGLSGACLISALKSCMFHRAIPIGLMTSSDSWVEQFRIYKADAIIKKEINLTVSVMDFLGSFHIGRDSAEHGTESDLKQLQANILLAEDCSMMHRLISRFLHVAGAEVVVVENGAEAVSIATRQPFDLILMDIEMPEMDGLEATRRLREQDVRVPVIAVTAHDGDECRRLAREAGIDEVVTKPVKRDVIIAKCAEYLRRSREAMTIGSCCAS